MKILEVLNNNSKSGVTKIGDCYVCYGNKVINPNMKEIKIISKRYRLNLSLN